MSSRNKMKAVVIQDLLKAKATKDETIKALGCSDRTLRRYGVLYIDYGPEGLKDKRGGTRQSDIKKALL